MNSFQRIARAVNTVIVPLLDTPLVGDRLSKSVALISYTGRRSGRIFSTPVNYERTPDGGLRIGVMMPERKNWWRNFYPEAAPIAVTIGGAERQGTAKANRTEDGVTVDVTFTNPNL